MTDLRSLQAGLMHALGEAGGELPLARTRLGPRGKLAEAIEDLDDLVELGPDGVVRVGPRGSLLAARDVEARLTTRRIGRPLEVLASCGSTNDEVLARAAGGAPAGLVVAAELQTRGRGRRRRPFDSRPGLGVWSSTLLPDPIDPRRAPRLSLLAGLAVAAAVEEIAGCAATLKWPNDVRAGGRKICGVLVEARAVGSRLLPVAGIGLNVHHRAADFPPELRDRATSVEVAAGRPIDRAEIFAVVLARLEELVERERAGGLDLAERFRARDECSDREVVISTAQGELTGRATGLAEDGSLLLEVKGRGTVTVRSGDASLSAREI